MWDSATAHINIFVHCVPKILCGSCPGSSVAPSIRDMTPPFESQRKPINSAYSPSLLTLFTAEGVGLGHELPGKFITSFFINQVLSTPSSSTSLRLRRILYTASVFLVPHPHAKQYPLKLRFLVFVCGGCGTRTHKGLLNPYGLAIRCLTIRRNPPWSVIRYYHRRHLFQ